MTDEPRGWVLEGDLLLGVRHGFFTRRGGVSQGAYASLNCSVSSADQARDVAENRRRVAAALGVDVTALLGLTQTHSADVHVLKRGQVQWRSGRGPVGDALVTDDPAIAVGVVTADCAPVLFADRARRIVGAAHAGWRGACGGVLEATVTAMRRLGAGEISAVVGPCIGQASYEVGSDMRALVLVSGTGSAPFFAPARRAEHFQFDLAGYVLNRLRRAGVRRVSALGLDTMPDACRFYSHRRRTLAGGGVIGHQISAIRAAGQA